MTRRRWAAPAAVAVLAACLSAATAGEIEISTLDHVKVAAFAQILSDATGRPYVVGGDVDTALNIIVPGGGPLRLQSEEVSAFGMAVLASAGLTVIDDGATRRIVRLPEGGGLALGALSAAPGADGLVTRVFRLQHVTAGDVRKALEGDGTRKGWITVLEASNHLVVTDTASTLARVAEVLAELDQPGLARTAEVVPLKFADAEQLAQQLNLAAAEAESRGSQLINRLQPTSVVVPPTVSGRGGLAVPSPHANSLILVGPQQQITEFKALIAKLDVDTPAGRGYLNALPLQYLKAEDAAKSITALLEKSAAKAGEGRGLRRIAVESSSVNNALLVDATPNDFELVRRLVEQLDRMPEQVHIAVMIAEVADGTGFTLGTQLTALNSPGEVGDTVVSGASRLNADQAPGILENAGTGIFPQGINVAVSHGVSVGPDGNLIIGYPGIVNITALRQNDKVEILSETALQAQNNVEATVSIVDEIPILKSTIQGGSGTARDVIQNIERQEVGVKLKLTPHVVPGGLVRMELNPSIEAVTSGATAENQFTPTIAKRTAATTVTVPDGQTIVIAGLTRHDRQIVDRRIPWLGDIPLLGWLFRYKSEQERRTNLLILVTPDILATPADAQAVAQAWRQKTGIHGDVHVPRQPDPH